MKKLSLLLLFLLVPTSAWAQSETLIISAVPTPSASCTIQRNALNTAWTCTAGAAASQPLTDSLGLIADNGDPTKILAFEVSAISTGTTRTITWPNANVTIPSTVASLSTNTFTGLQTLNGGLAATTGTFSSTLDATGNFAINTNKFTVAASSGNTVVAGTLGVTGAISSSASVALSGTTNNLGTITTGVWNAGAVTSSGAVTSAAGFILSAAGGGVAGGIFRNAFYGFALAAYTGSSYDFAILNPALAVDILRVPTGTSNVVIPSGALTVSGPITTTDVTQSTSISTGSIITAGGVGIAKQLVVGSTNGAATAPYSYLNGLRISGGDTTNTVYQPQGALGVTVQSGLLLLASYDAAGTSIQATHASGDVRISSRNALAVTFGANQEMLVGTTSNILGGGAPPRVNFLDSLNVQINKTTTAGAWPLLLWNGTTSSDSSFVQFGTEGTFTARGSIDYNRAGGAVRYNTTSDQRLKRDRGIATDTTILRHTTIHDFDWIETGSPSRGVFAQELVDVFPNAVSIGLDDRNANGTLVKPWGVDYGAFIPDLIVGWQEHEARLAALETRGGGAAAARPNDAKRLTDAKKNADDQKARATASAQDYRAAVTAAKTKADAALKAANDRQATEAKRQSIVQCQTDNTVIVAHGGAPLDCAPTAEEKAIVKAMQDEAVKAAADQKAKDLAECTRKNALITKQGGMPLSCTP